MFAPVTHTSFTGPRDDRTCYSEFSSQRRADRNCKACYRSRRRVSTSAFVRLRIRWQGCFAAASDILPHGESALKLPRFARSKRFVLPLCNRNVAMLIVPQTLKDAYKKQLVFYLNGKKVTLDKQVEPDTTLIHYLRSMLFALCFVTCLASLLMRVASQLFTTLNTFPLYVPSLSIRFRWLSCVCVHDS